MHMENSSKRGISAAILKNVAVLTMTIDHLTAFLLKDYLVSMGITDLYSNTFYWLGRVIGRIAFVLYAFMIAEGAYKTRNKVKYAGRLLLLALISIIPHSYVNTQKLFDPNDLNIFFLLFLGLITIYGWEWLKDHVSTRALSVALRLFMTAAACAAAELMKIEYGLMGVLLILVFHLFRYNIPKMLAAGALVMTVGYMVHIMAFYGPVRWFSMHSANLIRDLIRSDRIQVFGLLAFPFIYWYNGEKGRQLPKWFYYLYYPVHLGIIALIRFL